MFLCFIRRKDARTVNKFGLLSKFFYLLPQQKPGEWLNNSPSCINSYHNLSEFWYPVVAFPLIHCSYVLSEERMLERSTTRANFSHSRILVRTSLHICSMEQHRQVSSTWARLFDQWACLPDSAVRAGELLVDLGVTGLDVEEHGAPVYDGNLLLAQATLLLISQIYTLYWILKIKMNANLVLFPFMDSLPAIYMNNEHICNVCIPLSIQHLVYLTFCK